MHPVFAKVIDLLDPAMGQSDHDLLIYPKPPFTGHNEKGKIRDANKNKKDQESYDKKEPNG